MIFRSRTYRFFAALALGLATTFLVALPLRAAEQVVLEFGPFSRAIPTESLVNFAATGTVDRQLAPFLRRLNPAQIGGLQAILSRSRAVQVVPISQWFNSPMGDRSLQFLGKVAQTEAGLNGGKALRAAIVAAATEDGEISLIDIVRHFPTGEMRLNVSQAMALARQVRAEAAATGAIAAAIEQQSQAEAAQPPPLDLAALPDLTQPGPYGSRQISLTLVDAERNRTYPADVFIPQNLPGSGPIPVIVISHGLGDSRTTFFGLAAHAASHGFAVALPDHIGSNSTQKQAMLTGLDSETFKARDFLDRPLDISFLLDELDRLNGSTFGGRLDVSRVAAVGHSFGGYTALAVGGAKIDFERLAQRCDPAANLLIDAAMVLECRALELRDDEAVMARLAQGTQDDRVQLVMAFAPVSNLFGPRGLADVAVPVMLLGGEVDLLAPVVPQQVAAFSWLRGRDRYLYLGENTSHGPDFTKLFARFLYLDAGLEQGIDEAIATTQGVNRSLVVAFGQVYLAQREDYRPFLRSAYVETVSADPFRLHLVRDLPPAVVERLGSGQPGLE